MSNVELKDAVVLDVGCGLGGRAPFWLEQGASRVINVDINRQELSAGKEILQKRFPSYVGRIDFCHPADLGRKVVADVVILFDVFEHLTQPSLVLDECYGWLKPHGHLWIGSIGWYHYFASHCHGHIPIYWSQVIFSERAIIRTIQSLLHDPDYVPNIWERLEGLDRWDKVQTLKDRPGEPLNMLSLAQVRKILRDSRFEVSEFRVHTFSGSRSKLAGKCRWLTRIPVFNELFHSYYTAVLRKPAE